MLPILDLISLSQFWDPYHHELVLACPRSTLYNMSCRSEITSPNSGAQQDYSS
jgi:hypothetical protein